MFSINLFQFLIFAYAVFEKKKKKHQKKKKRGKASDNKETNQFKKKMRLEHNET